MKKQCPGLKPSSTSKTHLNELISWHLLKKNPSGAMIWGIFGASFIMHGYFLVHFLKHKEYQVINKHINLKFRLTLIKLNLQVEHKTRMWNERFEMLENPVRMKLYYPHKESVPKPCQPLIDAYKKMRDEETLRRKQIEECKNAINVKK